MKKRNLLKDLTVLMGTLTLFFCNSSRGDMLEHCEHLLGRVNSVEVELIDTLAELDNLKYGMPNEVSTEVDELVERALSTEANQEKIRSESRRLLERVIASISPSTCAVSAGGFPCLGEVIENPESLEAGRIYSTGDPHLRTVSVDHRAQKEISALDNLTIERLFRSVKKGIVPPVSGPGVVRLTDVHRNLVEVKIVRKGVTRLIGCLNGGHLTVMKVYHKRNEGKGGAWAHSRTSAIRTQKSRYSNSAWSRWSTELHVS